MENRKSDHESDLFADEYCPAKTNALDGETRSVKCGVCKEPMYYLGDSRHRAEVEVEVYNKDGAVFFMYAHSRCWFDVVQHASLENQEG
jgi:hypothetical protein